MRTRRWAGRSRCRGRIARRAWCRRCSGLVTGVTSAGRGRSGRSSSAGSGAGACGVTYALLPAFTLARRLDAADTAGAVIGQVVAGACGVRPAAAAAGVPHTTARDWVRRVASRAGELAVSFSALAVELGGEVVRPLPDPLRSAVAAIGAGFAAP